MQRRTQCTGAEKFNVLQCCTFACNAVQCNKFSHAVSAILLFFSHAFFRNTFFTADQRSAAPFSEKGRAVVHRSASAVGSAEQFSALQCRAASVVQYKADLCNIISHTLTAILFQPYFYEAANTLSHTVSAMLLLFGGSSVQCSAAHRSTVRYTAGHRNVELGSKAQLRAVMRSAAKCS